MRGIPVAWRSFPNHPHDVPEESARLAREFLAHHHWTRLDDLGGESVPDRGPAFVGDDADGVYHPAGSARAALVPPEDRVDLPSATVAAAWGRPGPDVAPRKGMRVSSEVLAGVEVVFAVPDGVRPDARILVLLGGRGWTGARALRDLGFKEWAEARGWSLAAPSFAEGDWWEPSGGSAEVLRRAVGLLRDHHGVRPYPVFLYGYSAGGSLVWRTMEGGHELGASALGLARAFFGAVASGAPCAYWGEDGTWRILERERIDPEYRSPLYTPAFAELWRRAR